MGWEDPASDPLGDMLAVAEMYRREYEAQSLVPLDRRRGEPARRCRGSVDVGMGLRDRCVLPARHPGRCWPDRRTC